MRTMFLQRCPEVFLPEYAKIDLVIENGAVLDGLGGPAIDADVVVVDDEIVLVGQSLLAGEPPTNGNWPPHFQLINDLLGPGVALRSRQYYWLELSPSPAQFFPELAADSLEYVETRNAWPLRFRQYRVDALLLKSI